VALLAWEKRRKKQVKRRRWDQQVFGEGGRYVWRQEVLWYFQAALKGKKVNNSIKHQ